MNNAAHRRASLTNKNSSQISAASAARRFKLREPSNRQTVPFEAALRREQRAPVEVRGWIASAPLSQSGADDLGARGRGEGEFGGGAFGVDFGVEEIEPVAIALGVEQEHAADLVRVCVHVQDD